MSAKKSGTASRSTHREYTLDLGKRTWKMVDEIGASKQASERFLADPAAVAKEYGVTLTPDDLAAIKFANGLQLASVLANLRRPQVAFFNNNCKCGVITAATRIITQ